MGGASDNVMRHSYMLYTPLIQDAHIFCISFCSFLLGPRFCFGLWAIESEYRLRSVLQRLYLFIHRCHEHAVSRDAAASAEIDR